MATVAQAPLFVRMGNVLTTTLLRAGFKLMGFGRYPMYLLTIRGRDAVTRMFLGTRRFWPETYSAEIGEVNGQDALLMRTDGQTWAVLTFEVAEGQFRASG